MDNVDPQSFPSHTNYQELADVFCFTGISSMNFALWFIYGKEHLTFYMWHLFFLAALWSILHLFCLPTVTLLEFVFVSLKYPFINLNLKLLPAIFVLGLAFLVFGFTGVSLVSIVYWLRKRYQGHYGTNFVSNQMFLLISHILCIISVNGYSILFYWCLKQASHVWRRLGVVLIGIMGFLTTICCILRIVSRWRKFHRSRVRVASVTNSIDVA